MATIKCYSGGKLVKTFKNVKKEQIYTSCPLAADGTDNYEDGIGNGIIIKDRGDSPKFYWRGDFLVEY